MKPRISLITLGVDDLKASLRFYRDGLGLETPGVIGTEFEYGAVVFFDLQANLKLALYPRKSLAKDSGLPLGAPGALEFSIGHNVSSKAEVNQVMEQAKNAGAVIVKPAQDTFWGGFAGYFQDPNGHLWEIVWNPQWPIPVRHNMGFEKRRAKSGASLSINGLGTSPLTMTEIRECKESDLSSCSTILREVYSESPYKECWPEDRAREYLEAFFRIDPKGAFVATDNGKLLGALFGYAYPWHTGSVFFIQELFVSRKRRGEGIGRRLVIHALETRARNATVALIVREGTDAAKFYEKLGLSKSEIYALRSGIICV